MVLGDDDLSRTFDPRSQNMPIIKIRKRETINQWLVHNNKALFKCIFDRFSLTADTGFKFKLIGNKAARSLTHDLVGDPST